ncbi:MAG: PDZ domain-containing protein [Phycisphaerae bacterium]
MKPTGILLALMAIIGVWGAVAMADGDNGVTFKLEGLDIKPADGKTAIEGEVQAPTTTWGPVSRPPAANSGWIGITISPVPPPVAAQLDVKGGVMIQNVAKDSPADKAELERYDMIVSVGKDKVTGGVEGFRKLVAELKPEAKVELGVIHKAKAREVRITLGRLTDPGKVRYKYEDEPLAHWQEQTNVRGWVLPPGGESKWLKMPDGDAAEILADPRVLEQLPQEFFKEWWKSAAGSMLVGSVPGEVINASSGDGALKVVQVIDGTTLEIDKAANGRITVKRTVKTEDGPKTTTKTYEQMDNLRKADPKAAEVLEKVKVGGTAKFAQGTADTREIPLKAQVVAEEARLRAELEKVRAEAEVRAKLLKEMASENPDVAARAKAQWRQLEAGNEEKPEPPKAGDGDIIRKMKDRRAREEAGEQKERGEGELRLDLKPDAGQEREQLEGALEKLSAAAARLKAKGNEGQAQELNALMEILQKKAAAMHGGKPEARVEVRDGTVHLKRGEAKEKEEEEEEHGCGCRGEREEHRAGGVQRHEGGAIELKEGTLNLGKDGEIQLELKADGTVKGAPFRVEVKQPPKFEGQVYTGQVTTHATVPFIAGAPVFGGMMGGPMVCPAQPQPGPGVCPMCGQMPPRCPMCGQPCPMMQGRGMMGVQPGRGESKPPNAPPAITRPWLLGKQPPPVTAEAPGLELAAPAAPVAAPQPIRNSFTVNPDGAIEVRIIRDGNELVLRFKNSEDLKAKSSKLFEAYTKLMSAL